MSNLEEVILRAAPLVITALEELVPLAVKLSYAPKETHQEIIASLMATIDDLVEVDEKALADIEEHRKRELEEIDRIPTKPG